MSIDFRLLIGSAVSDTTAAQCFFFFIINSFHIQNFNIVESIWDLQGDRDVRKSYTYIGT